MPTSSVVTDVLSIGYEHWGESSSDATVVALHGFPDDARSWEHVGRRLAADGVRVVAPYLRGFGPTEFLRADTPRSGQLGALVADLVAFLDGLGVDRVTVVGQDWGSRAGQGLAALHPARVDHLVSLSSYGLSWDDEGFPPPPVLQALWYQWVLLTDLGPAMMRFDPGARTAFLRHLWDVWSPTWPGRGEAFRAAADSLDNADLVEVVLSAYRHGRAEAVSDPRHDDVDTALAAGPVVDVPATVLLGADDGVELPREEDQRDARFFPRLVERRLLPGVGHFVHREAPDAVADAVLAAVRSRVTA